MTKAASRSLKSEDLRQSERNQTEANFRLSRVTRTAPEELWTRGMATCHAAKLQRLSFRPGLPRYHWWHSVCWGLPVYFSGFSPLSPATQPTHNLLIKDTKSSNRILQTVVTIHHFQNGAATPESTSCTPIRYIVNYTILL